ncbi:hypothetical protein N7470_003887 [Penicillium chermesinum]|nr:hypothetical protein N7470_003887 [Penicillium chermesinum]
MSHEALYGTCSCGRNHYRVSIPDDVTEHAHVYFDSSRDNRRLYGTPLTAWLRVPLDWYESYTTSFFPDETHSSIRRAFAPPHAPETRRIFCGFCGTPLTFWTEEPREEAEFLSISVGSLLGDHQRALEDLNLLPGDSDEDDTPVATDSSSLTPSLGSSSIIVPSREEAPALSRNIRSGTLNGIPWFEEMVEGSRLGRVMKSKRGKGVSKDNTTSFEWEISEWYDDGTPSIRPEDSESGSKSTGKRRRVQ